MLVRKVLDVVSLGQEVLVHVAAHRIEQEVDARPPRHLDGGDEVGVVCDQDDLAHDSALGETCRVEAGPHVHAGLLQTYDLEVIRAYGQEARVRASEGASRAWPFSIRPRFLHSHVHEPASLGTARH